MKETPGKTTFQAISDNSRCDYALGGEREEDPFNGTINYLGWRGIATHVIVETKQEKFQPNAVAQVRSSFVSIY